MRLAAGSGEACGGQNCSAIRRQRGRGTMAWRVAEGILDRFRSQGGEEVDGAGPGHDGVASRAHWPRELTAMATTGSTDFSRSTARGGGGEKRGGGVQGKAGGILIASPA